MNRYPGALLLLITFILGSCSLPHAITTLRRSRPATDSSKIVISVPQHAVLPAQDTQALRPDTAGVAAKLKAEAAPLFSHRFAYRTFSCKAKVNFESPDDGKEFSAVIRVKKDSAIWVAIVALGVPLARVYITPDSFYMTNSIQHEAIKISLSRVGQVLPTSVDFKSLQNLVLGDPLRDGAVFAASDLATSWLLTVADSAYVQGLMYDKKDSSLLSDQVNTKDPAGPQAVWLLSDYREVEGRHVSYSRTVNIQNGPDKYKLEMDIKDVEFDKVLEMPFSIPKSYSIKTP